MMPVMHRKSIHIFRSGDWICLLTNRNKNNYSSRVVLNLIGRGMRFVSIHERLSGHLDAPPPLRYHLNEQQIAADEWILRFEHATGRVTLSH